MLKEVPGVKEHLNQPSIQKGKIVLKKRFDLGYTQSELVKKVMEFGISLDIAELKRIEGGDYKVSIELYDNLVNKLEMVPPKQI